MSSIRVACLLAVLALQGCGGGSGGGAAPASVAPPVTPPAAAPPAPTSMLVEGAVQKGPFLVGTPVWINRRDVRGNSTAATLRSEIKDSVGSFSFETDASGPVLLEATGYYFSELTGQISNGTLTLKGLYEVGSSARQVAYVNILTHLITDRVLKLIAGGQITFRAALEQAEDELVVALSDALVIPNLNEFSALSVYDSTNAQNNTLGNAYLLALSTGLYKYAEIQAKKFGATTTDGELTLALNRLSDDLADDGKLQPGPFIGEFVTAIRSLSPETIAANLRSRSLVDYPKGLGVPDITVFLNLCAGNFDCPWRAGAPMPKVSRGHATAVHNGKIYVFGGMTPLSWRGPRKDGYETDAYDPAANEWTPKRQMPGAVLEHGAHTIGDKIYVVPGTDVVGYLRNELYVYDPIANQWSAGAARPTYRTAFASAAVNGKLYVLGGTGALGDGPGQYEANLKSHVEIYDPVTNHWSSGPPLPWALSGGRTCVFGDKIYVLGGTTLANRWDQSILAYDTTSSSWTVKSPMPNGRFDFACAVVDGVAYLTGGHAPNSYTTLAGTVERYDPFVETWSAPTRLKTPRYELSADVVGKLVITMGGLTPTTSAPTPVNVVEVLNTGGF